MSSNIQNQNAVSDKKSRAAAKKEQIREQVEADWLERSKNWQQRAAEVLKFFMEESENLLDYYQVLTNPPLGPIPAFQIREKESFSARILYLSAPDQGFSIATRNEALFDLEMLESRQSDVLTERAEDTRKQAVLHQALLKLAEKFTDEEIELLNLTHDVSNALFKAKRR